MSIDVTIEISAVELDAYILMERQPADTIEISSIIPMEATMSVEEVPYKITMTEE